MPWSADAVSYTHLDVYKRQVLRGMHYVSLYAAEQTIDTLTFLVFLLLFVPQFDVLGIYPNFVKELE